MIRDKAFWLAASLLLASTLPGLAAPTQYFTSPERVKQTGSYFYPPLGPSQVQNGAAPPLPTFDSSRVTQFSGSSKSAPSVVSMPAVTGPAIVDGNEQNFQSYISQRQQPILVEFYATWCGHCKKMDSVLQTFSQKYPGSARVVRVDIDKNPGLVSKYAVGPVPAFFVFSQGSVIDRVVGETDVSRLSSGMNKGPM